MDGEIRIDDVSYPSSAGAALSVYCQDPGGIEVLPRCRNRCPSVCDIDRTPGEPCEYYVQLDGKTLRIVESNLLVASHRGDPDPQLQLASFELQNPSFRQPRDRLVESYSELRSATFGIEDLVGSRIMLLAHQAEVVATVLSDPECRYILADEVGLGKTIEATGTLKGLRRRRQALRLL